MKSFTTVLFAFSILIIGITQGQDTEVCEDEEQYISQCPGWADSGECTGNAAFMTASCKKSCDFCKVETVEDLQKELKEKEEIDKDFMSKVLSRLRINDEDNVIQDDKIQNLEELEGEVEVLEKEVEKQGELLNKTKKAVDEQFQRLTNLTEILEGEGKDDSEENEVEDSDSKETDGDTGTAVVESVEVGSSEQDSSEGIDIVIPQKPKYKCPEKDKKNYKIIDKQCYFFNINRQKFGDAALKCKQVFNNDTKGRIFEPRTIERNDKVLEATKEFTDGKSFNFWLGITDEDEEGKFKYQSDDKFVDENFGNGKPAMPWFADGRIKEPNGGKGANCVYAFSKNNRWFDFRCARSRVYSICELPVIGIENAQDSAEDV